MSNAVIGGVVAVMIAIFVIVVAMKQQKDKRDSDS